MTRGKLDRIEQSKQLECDRVRRITDDKAAKEASGIVKVWNARIAGGRRLWFHATIGAAIAADLPWLSFYCPGCGQVGDVDVRRLDRHRGATIESLIPALSCRRCRPNPPFARVVGFFQRARGRTLRAASAASSSTSHKSSRAIRSK